MDIKPYEKNIKKHSKEQLYKIACSLRDFGWRQPIVVDKDGVIIVGHGRWFAYERYAKEMSLTEPRVEVASDLTPEQVHVYRLADNMVASTDYDMDAVNTELAQIGIAFEPYQALLNFDSTGQTEKKEVTDEAFINDAGILDYLNNSIRQLVCIYPQKEYTELTTKCEELRRIFGLQNNSELFKKLIEETYANNTSN